VDVTTFSVSFGFVLLLFAYFFVLLWFRLPLAKSRDKEKKGNKLPFGGRKAGNIFVPEGEFASPKGTAKRKRRKEGKQNSSPSGN
jgi:hypothetical protein